MHLNSRFADLFHGRPNQDVSCRCRFRGTKPFRAAVFCFCSFSLVGMRAPSQEASSSQPVFKVIVSFDGANGAQPAAGLIQGANGNFYGTTEYGGSGTGCDGPCGTVFEVTAAGKLTSLHSFAGNDDGALPVAGLVQGADGDLYGTTSGGATADCDYGCGTVFKITPAGKLTTLYSFYGSTDGALPAAGLVLGADGNFYGTNQDGATAHCAYTCGTVFKITPEGALTTLYDFGQRGVYDGIHPAAGLVQGTDGFFYGTTAWGGKPTTSSNNCIGPINGSFGLFGCGTVFKMGSKGSLATLHNFGFTDGYDSLAGLVQGTDGNFYGTTSEGGVYASPCLSYGCGTAFKITPEGALTTLHIFCTGADCSDGGQPTAALVQGSDGNFYGTTSVGGASSIGTIFKITPQGELTTLHSFDGTDGAQPSAALTQGTDGSFYGTTLNGGAENAGTIFSLSVGLGPFVETRPTFGAVGTTVEILGNNLMDITGVTFNGIAAEFKAISCSEITATVPAGATTGKIEVKTGTGTLLSNIAFRVTP